MTKIPLKKKWVNVGGWRGYYEYDNSVLGGSIHWGDEYHNKEEMERIKKAKAILKKSKISYRVKVATTSNVCANVFDVVVKKDDVTRAKKLLKRMWM
jgi:hypothetical protein